MISRSADGIDPFRIGIVSRAKYDESRRMAALTASTEDEFSDVVAQTSEAAATASDSDVQTTAEYEAAFRSYIEELMVEGRLNYVAYMGELDRLTLSLANGKGRTA